MHRVSRPLFEARDFARMEAPGDVGNVGAQRVVARLGFTCEGVTRHAERDVDRALTDIVAYTLCGVGDLQPPVS